MAKSKLVECQFLIPLRRDDEISDGELTDTRIWRWLHEQLFDQFGGWSVLSDTVEGAWRVSCARYCSRPAIDLANSVYT
jgi:hypothetical protein